MKREKPVSRHILKLCFCAVLAAMICACTFISVPLPIGYFNLGDVAVLLGAYTLGAPAAISAALGSALADLLMGYAAYAPATAIIKAAVALIAFALTRFACARVGKWASLPVRLLCALLAETVMVAGYLLFEAFALGYGAAALASVVGNCLQGACGAIGSAVIYAALDASGALGVLRGKKRE